MSSFSTNGRHSYYPECSDGEKLRTPAKAAHSATLGIPCSMSRCHSSRFVKAFANASALFGSSNSCVWVLASRYASTKASSFSSAITGDTGVSRTHGYYQVHLISRRSLNAPSGTCIAFPEKNSARIITKSHKLRRGVLVNLSLSRTVNRPESAWPQ